METPIYDEVERDMVLREFAAIIPKRRWQPPAWVVLTWIAALLLLVVYLASVVL